MCSKSASRRAGTTAYRGFAHAHLVVGKARIGDGVVVAATSRTTAAAPSSTRRCPHRVRVVHAVLVASGLGFARTLPVLSSSSPSPTSARDTSRPDASRSSARETADPCEGHIATPDASSSPARETADVGAETHHAAATGCAAAASSTTASATSSTDDAPAENLASDRVQLCHGAVDAGIPYAEPGGDDDAADRGAGVDPRHPRTRAAGGGQAAAHPVGLRGHPIRRLPTTSAAVCVDTISARVLDMVESGRAVVVGLGSGVRVRTCPQKPKTPRRWR